jgi:hypothetical protein
VDQLGAAEPLVLRPCGALAPWKSHTFVPRRAQCRLLSVLFGALLDEAANALLFLYCIVEPTARVLLGLCRPLDLVDNGLVIVLLQNVSSTVGMTDGNQTASKNDAVSSAPHRS